MRALRLFWLSSCVAIAFSAPALAQAGGEKKGVAQKEAKPAGPTAMKFVATEEAPKAIGPYAQAELRELESALRIADSGGNPWL